MNHRHLCLAAVLVLVTGVVGEAETRISASASVNPDIIDIEQSASPNSSVRATADDWGAYSHAYADTDFVLGTTSRSENAFLTRLTGSHAHSSAGFSLQGNPDGAHVPLKFNFHFTGSLYATSEVNNYGSVAVAAMNYWLQTSTDNRSGHEALMSQGGVPTRIGDGSMDPITKAILTPTLTPEGWDPVELPPIEFTLEEFDGINFDFLALNLITSAVNRTLVPGGVPVEVGYDSEFNVNGGFSVTADLQTTDVLYVALGCSSQSSGPMSPASSSSNFRNTLVLESITAPADYDALDVNDLRVVFDSGLTMAVTPEAPPVPEPSTLALALWTLLGSLGIIAIRRRSQLCTRSVSRRPRHVP